MVRPTHIEWRMENLAPYPWDEVRAEAVRLLDLLCKGLAENMGLTISRDRLKRLMGACGADKMGELNEAIKAAFDVP